MGKSDLETDAVLTQLNFEELSKTPGGELAEIVGDLLALIGTGGPWSVTGVASNLLLKIRKLAGASYASNLIYALTAVRNDLADLYAKHADLHKHIESLQTDPRFAEAIASLALRAMHTSVKDRLRRLARIVVSGVKDDDLESESLDDMMRAAVELKEVDVLLLRAICGSLNSKSKEKREPNFKPGLTFDEISEMWKRLDEKQTSMTVSCMGALTRLQAHGLIHSHYNAGDGTTTRYDLLSEGKKFNERLQEIGSTK